MFSDLRTILKRREKVSIEYILFVAFFYFFIFKDWLESFAGVLGYADELLAVLAIPLFFWEVIRNKGKLESQVNSYVCFICLFLVIGLMGNLVSAYQSTWYSLIDAFICIKFWLAIYVGRKLLKNFSIKENASGIYFHCKVIIALFSLLTLADYVFNIFETTSVRFGIKAIRLFYTHETVFAAACALVMVIMVSIMQYVKVKPLYPVLLLFLMCCSLRIKAIAAVAVFLLIFFVVLHLRKKVKVWMLLTAAAVVLIISWGQIQSYFFNPENIHSARYQFFIASFSIAKDHFPFGSGFGTFASYYSVVHESLLYAQYGLDQVIGLHEGGAALVNDMFWPMILGQAGWFGLAAYVAAVVMLFLQIQRLKDKSLSAYAAALCILGYLLISSTSESAFVHPLAIPLAFWLGSLLNTRQFEFVLWVGLREGYLSAQSHIFPEPQSKWLSLYNGIKSMILYNSKKVAVITRHAILNYGSLLQAIATQQILKNLGYTCEIVDYIREDEHYRNQEKTLVIGKPYYSSYIKRIAYLALRQPESVIAGKRFDKMRKKYLHLTKQYTDLSQLQLDKPQADIYMTGSDQVWGPVMDGTFDSAYCLSFTADCDRRIAFAASFGRTKFTQETEAFYKKWLSRYEAIAVREDSAVQLLNSWGLQAKQVIDPTLMLDSAYWGRLTTDIKKKYILVYQIHNDKKLDRYAKAAAKRVGLPLVRVSASFHQCVRGGKFKFCPDIGEFLSYIKNAQCLITDSFHGTAFALNFNTPFVEVLPGETSTRNMSILRLTGLTDRILKDENDVDLAFKPVDFTHANKVLEEKRKASLSILKEMLGEAK